MQQRETEIKPTSIETEGLPLIRNIDAIKTLLSRQVLLINSSPVPDDQLGSHYRAHESQGNDTWIEVFTVNGKRYATHATIFVPNIERDNELRDSVKSERIASLLDELHYQGIDTEYLDILQTPIDVTFEPQNANFLRENKKPRTPRFLSREFLGILARTAITGKVTTWKTI